METIYQEHLLDLYHHPLNKQALNTFSVRHKESNPLCGDEMEIFIKFDKNDRVSAIGWIGEGCAISQAATSLITDYIKKKKQSEIKKIKSGLVLEMLGLEKLNPTRLRCALLALEAIKKII